METKVECTLEAKKGVLDMSTITFTKMPDDVVHISMGFEHAEVSLRDLNKAVHVMMESAKRDDG